MLPSSPQEGGMLMKTADNPVNRRTREPLHLRTAPRCGADETRDARQSKAANGKRRCRLHGGAVGSGAPSGARNGNYRHGCCTQAAMAERRLIRQVLGQSWSFLQAIEGHIIPSMRAVACPLRSELASADGRSSLKSTRLCRVDEVGRFKLLEADHFRDAATALRCEQLG
jgi:hypothetical protein